METSASSQIKSSPPHETTLPSRPKKIPQTPQERAHLLQSRRPLDMHASSSKPRRTRSFSEYKPAGREPLAEISEAMGSETRSRRREEHEDGVIMRMKAPHDNVTLRHIRRRDMLSAQRLLTRKVLDNMGNDGVEKPNDFGSSVKYIEGLIEPKDWIPVNHRFDRDDGDDGDDGDGASSDENRDSKKVPKAFAIAMHDRLIGAIDIWSHPEDDDRSAELVYWLGEEYWGRGIASMVVKAYVDWVWKTFSWIVRVDAGVYSTWNPASRRVLEKTGLKYEGTMRKALWGGKEKGFSDIELWGMLREEWSGLARDKRSP